MRRTLTYWPEATEDPVISAILARAGHALSETVADADDGERDPDELDPPAGPAEDWDEDALGDSSDDVG
jgi:hypothetical protein